MRKEQPPFQINNKVWLFRRNIKTTQLYDKLDYQRLGPLHIQQQINPVAYRLKLPVTMKVHLIFHVSFLEPYKESTLNERTQPPPPFIQVDNHEEYKVDEVLDSRQ